MKSLDIFQTKLGGLEASLETLKSNSDLSFHFLNNFEIIDKTIVQSKLDGSIIKNCMFKNTNLTRSDLNAVRVENCSFFNVDFSSTDIISSIFSNCNFINCNFDDAHISDCDFINSKFENTSFTSCSFLKSTIKDSSFKESILEQSTNVLNKYYNTSFCNMSLGNCTFEYHIVKNCHFESVTLNTDSLAYIYGYTMKQLSHVNLIFLGKNIVNQPKIDQHFINDLFDGFVNKHWLLGALLLKMNFKQLSIYNCLNLIIELFIKQNELGFLLKADELQFFVNILYELKDNGELPTLSLENFISKIDTINKNEMEKNRLLLSNLKSSAIQLKSSQEEELDVLFSRLNTTQQIKAELVFERIPKISPQQFFTDMNNCYSVDISIVGVREGSFIVEILCGTVVIVKLLDCLMKLTGNPIKVYENGVVILELLKNPKYKKQYKNSILYRRLHEDESNNKRKKNQTENIKKPDNSAKIITSDDSITATTASFWFSYITDDSSFGGYGRNNFHEINIKKD